MSKNIDAGKLTSKNICTNLLVLLHVTGNFQAFVQPALGVLMIGSIAGGFLQDEEEEAGGM